MAQHGPTIIAKRAVLHMEMVAPSKYLLMGQFQQLHIKYAFDRLFHQVSNHGWCSACPRANLSYAVVMVWLPPLVFEK